MRFERQLQFQMRGKLFHNLRRAYDFYENDIYKKIIILPYSKLFDTSFSGPKRKHAVQSASSKIRYWLKSKYLTHTFIIYFRNNGFISTWRLVSKQKDCCKGEFLWILRLWWNKISIFTQKCITKELINQCIFKTSSGQKVEENVFRIRICLTLRNKNFNVCNVTLHYARGVPTLKSLV